MCFQLVLIFIISLYKVPLQNKSEDSNVSNDCSSVVSACQVGVKASSVTGNETTALMNGLQIGARSVKNVVKRRNWQRIGISPGASYLMALWQSAHGCNTHGTGINDRKGVCRLFSHRHSCEM